jgi:hypothetical protein
MSLLLAFSIAFQCHCQRTKPPLNCCQTSTLFNSKTGVEALHKAFFVATLACCINGLVIRNVSAARFLQRLSHYPKTPLSNNFHFRCSRSHFNTYTHATTNLLVSYLRQHVKLRRKQDHLSNLPRKPDQSLRHSERRSPTDELVQSKHQDHPSQARRLWQHPTAKWSVSCRAHILSTSTQAGWW